MSEDVLYAPGEPIVFLPYGMAANASKARYRGWRELYEMDMIDWPYFDPRRTTAHVRWMYRYTDHPYAEETHSLTDDPMTPGAYKVWRVEVSE